MNARGTLTTLRRWLLAVACLVTATVLTAATAPRTWRTAWYAQPPLQYVARHGEIDIVTGLDVQLIRAIGREAGRLVRLDEVPWEQQQAQLRSGERDFAFGATWTAEREKFVRFSAPYRYEENALYIRSRELPRFAFKDVASFLALVRAEHLRMGIVKATAYLLPEVDAFVRDPANAAYLIPSETDAENLQALIEGEVDVALSERLAAATITTQLGYDAILTEHPVPFGRMEVKAMFSRVSTTEADVEDFNRALRALQANGEFDHILRSYLLPPLLDIAVGGRWFYWLDLIGTIAFALSGVILAHRGRYNLVGAFVLSALPAVGGGILRDIVTGRRPVGVLRSPVPLAIVVGLVIAGYLFFKLMDRRPAGTTRLGRIAAVFDALCAFFDTIGLAAFTVTGVRIAVEMGCEPLWLWGPLLAALTGAGGGILRDIVRADFHNPTLKRGFYAEVALVWGLLFSLFLEWEVRGIGLDQVRRGTLLVLAGTFVTRMVIIYRRWENPFLLGNRHTLPERRLVALIASARALAAELPAWFEEREGVTQPRSLVDIEKRHTEALRRFTALEGGAHDLELESLAPDLLARVAAFRRELDFLAAAESALYGLVREPVFAAEPAQRLQHAIFASAAALGQAAASAAQSPDDRATFLALTDERGDALEGVRARFAAADNGLAADERARMLQFTVRFERLVQLLRDASRSGATTDFPLAPS